MKELVRLRMRPSRNKKSFRYMLDYRDQNDRRRQISLGHADKRRAERQRYEKELELPTDKEGLVRFEVEDGVKGTWSVVEISDPDEEKGPLVQTKAEIEAETE